MSQSENSNCFCQTISIEENTLTFLRISVNLLRLCASEPILYETTAPGHNDSIKKDTVWSKIAIDWQLYDPSKSYLFDKSYLLYFIGTQLM